MNLTSIPPEITRFEELEEMYIYFNFLRNNDFNKY